MDSLSTVESITKWLTEQVEQRQPIGPEIWLEAASRINVLLQAEQEKLFQLEQDVAKLRGLLLEAGEPVSKAKAKIEATDEYTAARKQRAKIERALELIRISKLQSRMASDVMRGQL